MCVSTRTSLGQIYIEGANLQNGTLSFDNSYYPYKIMKLVVPTILMMFLVHVCDFTSIVANF